MSLKAIKTVGKVEEGKYYKVKLIIPSTKLVKLVDEDNKLMPGAYDPNVVFGKSLVEIAKIVSLI